MGPYILAGIGVLVCGLVIFADDIIIAVAKRNQTVRLWVYRHFDVDIQEKGE